MIVIIVIMIVIIVIMIVIIVIMTVMIVIMIVIINVVITYFNNTFQALTEVEIIFHARVALTTDDVRLADARTGHLVAGGARYRTSSVTVARSTTANLISKKCSKV